MEPAEAGHAAADQVHVARDITTSPADFTVGLQPCPPAALPQALGRFLQEASLPPRPRPSHLALSFRPVARSSAVRYFGGRPRRVGPVTT